MSKINRSGEYSRINIPQYIIDITGWDENTELVFIPYINNPEVQVTKDTPILIKAVNRRKAKKSKGDKR